MGDLPDSSNMQKAFEMAYGRGKGRRLLRIVLLIAIPVLVVGIVFEGIQKDWHLIRLAYNEVAGWFSPQSTKQAGQPGPTDPTQNCTINNGINYGKIEQNCK